MKVWARHLVLGLLLAAAIPSAPTRAAESAQQILLDKANYWRLKDRSDLAIEALQKLLSINPNQPDALYQYGTILVQQGKIDEAKGYLARLQKAAPSSPRIAELENSIRAGQVSPNELSEARRLAQTGQFSQAAKKYEQTFKGPPPPTFGVEYYMTLAGTAQGWDEARKGLEAIVKNSPSDSKAKLALAQVETYHADTRPHGIEMLEQLVNDPVVGGQAAAAWKQAMMWLGSGPQATRLYNQYLARYPADADVRQHMAEAEKAGAAGPAAPGYSDLNRGNLAAAERQFEAELKRNPSDPNALAGLGIVRLRQHRLAQARELLAHAVTEYRRALASAPNDRAAQAGLRGALAAERSAQTAGIPRPGAAAGPAVTPARARADALRTEGQNLEAQGNVAAAGAKYQEAIAVDPTDPWARLDYARFLARSGNVAQGFAVIDPAASGDTADSFYAAAIFYDEQNRGADALALLDRVAPRSRTAAMTAFRERIYLTAEIAHAKQLASSGNRGAARNLLIALNSRPPTSRDKTALIANALADVGDLPEALQLARPTAAADKKAILDYAGLLFRAGRDAEAVAYLAQTERSDRFTATDRHELEHIKIDIAAKRADALRERSDYAGAWDQISSLLAAYPNDPTLLLAAGRIYAGAGQNGVAMRFIDAAFHQAPGDIGIIRGAVGGAIVAGDLTRARAYLAYGMQIAPNNPRLYYLDAQIARASGDNGRAMYSLRVAQHLANPQTGLAEALPPLPRGGPITVPPPPSNLPPNPFRRAAADTPRPPIQLAAAASLVSATDAVDASPPAAAPLGDTAVSADSDDLLVPPRSGERPPRPARRALPAADPPAGLPQALAALPPASEVDGSAGSDVLPTEGTPAARPSRRHVAQLEPLPPPPIPAYQQAYPTAYPPGYAQAYQPAYQPAATMAYAAPSAPALQPLPPPPIAGYQPPQAYLSAAPAPQGSLESDIEHSMAAIAAEAGPTLQGGLAFRARDGENGLSRLTEIGVPVEGTFSPFYTGTARFQAIPTFITAGKPAFGSLPRFGHEALQGLTSGTAVPLPGSQDASGVSLNVAYAYQIFDAEVGTTPLGFPVENLVGRLALIWPPPATVTTVLPTIPLAPTNASNPVHVVAEAVRKPITESVLSYAGTKDPVSGLVWGGVVKTGGDFLVSYDDGDVGVYGGGGGWSIDGKSVASNSEFEGLVGAYVRPYRVGTTSFKIGVNLSYAGYDKNLRFFTFGQGGYFSPQSYVNVGIPMEYSGQTGRFTYLAGGAIGVQTFHENSSPAYPLEPGKQAALRAGIGALAFYPSRSVTGPAFSAKGQLEYQLNGGFSIGGLATVDNAQNFTEGVAKLYLRKSFGIPAPITATQPYLLPGTL
jgi:tetratricopeptide (TPR) repeat protein